MLRLFLYKGCIILTLLQALSIGIRQVHPHISEKIFNKGDKIPCTTHSCSPYGSTHIQMYNFQKFVCSHPPIVEKTTLYCCLSMHASQININVEEKRWMVPTTHHILNHVNTLHIKMPNLTILKFKCILFLSRLCQIGTSIPCTLMKFI